MTRFQNGHQIRCCHPAEEELHLLVDLGKGWPPQDRVPCRLGVNAPADEAKRAWETVLRFLGHERGHHLLQKTSAPTLYHWEVPKKTLGVPYYPRMTERDGFYRAWEGIFRRGRAAISHLSSGCGKICPKAGSWSGFLWLLAQITNNLLGDR